jgi:hypothetical protein
MPERIFMKLGMYITTPETILHKSLPSVCLFVCVSLLSNVARQRLGKLVPAATYKHNNRRVVGDSVLYAVRAE